MTSYILHKPDVSFIHLFELTDTYTIIILEDINTHFVLFLLRRLNNNNKAFRIKSNSVHVTVFDVVNFDYAYQNLKDILNVGFDINRREGHTKIH